MKLCNTVFVRGNFQCQYIFILLSVLLIGCSKRNNLVLEPSSVNSMVLIYIAANNDLKFEAEDSFRKIKQGYKFDPKNRILVYSKTQSTKSYLLTLGDNNVDTLQTYWNENSSDANFLKKLISDSRKQYSAKKYGLVLWSHATSWKPSPKTKSFGQDEGYEMDIKDLALSLPNDLEFIIFDACTMASLEVLYEMRKNAKYILASPSEILSTSFPYQHFVNDLFSGVEGLKKVAANFIEYYEQKTGLNQSATISLIRTDKLESIALETKRLLVSKTPVYPFNKKDIQKMTFDTFNNVSSYDFKSFLRHNFQSHEYIDLDNRIHESIIFKGNTGSFLGSKIVEFSGLSVYLPEANDTYSNYYKSLKWNEDSEWLYLFK